VYTSCNTDEQIFKKNNWKVLALFLVNYFLKRGAIADGHREKMKPKIAFAF